jgi:arylsulfatase A-like enzyme
MRRLGLKISAVTLIALLALFMQAANTSELIVGRSVARGLAGGIAMGGGGYACGDCNVILISIDTLRQDHVGAYGYERDTTPNVDEFAADSIRFDTAIAHAPSTLPSHASIFTSMIPEHHRAFHSKDQPLPDEAVTMAELFALAGFRTAAFTAGAQMSEKYGLDQGFDIYDSYKSDMTHRSRFSDIVDKATGFLDDYGDEQFFLLLHTYEVHTPYTPRPEYLEMFDPDYEGSLGDEIDVPFLRSVFQNPVRLRLSDADREHIIAAYDGEIRNMDDAFGDLIAMLKERDLYDNTLIVFTSDHGEEFGERGRVGWHSWTLYEELLRVPLLIKMPAGRFAGRAVTDIARGIDLLPTMLDVAAIETESPFEGHSLMGRVAGRDSDVVFTVSQRDHIEMPTSIRTARWKFYDDALYDLAADPGERFDVSEHYPWVRASLEVNLALIRSRRALADADRLELDDEMRDQLRALGYIQ